MRSLFFSKVRRKYYRKCCNKLHKTSYKLSINCNILFGSYLQQVAGTSYGKLQERVTSCCNNLEEQTTSF